MRPLVEKFIKEMVTAMRSRVMYGPGHKLAKEAAGRLVGILAEIFSKTDEITLGIVGDEIAFEKEPFYRLSQTMAGFIADLKEIGIEKITFLRCPGEDEIAAFLDIITKNAGAIKEAGGVIKMMEASAITHIFIGSLASADELDAGTISDDIAKMATSVFSEGEHYLKYTFEGVKRKRAVDISAARVFVVKLIGNLARNRHSLLMLTSIKSHDEYTFIHSINVAIFSVIQAEALRLGERLLTEIGIAGLLHDTGKLIISGDILRKPKALDERDLEEMHKHPVDGARILLETAASNPIAAIAAFEHHVRLDQKGYPPRLFGGPMNPASMMISIADVYDALRSKRAYHEDMAPEKTYDEMTKLSGSGFDPKLLLNFFQVIGVYPPGTLVELDDRSIGIVLKESSTDITRPQIEILYDGAGKKMTSSPIVNLLEKDRATQKYKMSIVKSIASGKINMPDKYKV